MLRKNNLDPFLNINIKLSLNLLCVLNICYTDNLNVIWSWKIRDWEAGNPTPEFPQQFLSMRGYTPVIAPVLKDITEQL